MGFQSKTASAMGWLVLTALCTEAQAGPRAKNELTATHITLYDCGLAQVEQQTRVSGAQKIGIHVSLAHLDDLLASLVLATDGTVKVKGVTYPSVQNLAQAAAASGMAIALSELEDQGESLQEISDYVRALIGTSVAVTDEKGKVVRGTVLGAVQRLKDGYKTVGGPDGEERFKAALEPALVLVSKDGAMVWVGLDRITEIAAASRRESSAIRNFATQMGKANGFTDTSVVLETTEDSKGTLAVSYIRQMPLWRAVYRVAVDNDRISLQAWAVVHNDTNDDWSDVQMTLISGLPKSYVLSLASARYAEREGLDLGEEANMMPQLGANTPDSLLYDFDISFRGATFGYGGLGLTGTGYGRGGSGEGTIGSGSLAYSGARDEMGSSLLEVGRPAVENQMAARVEGEISTYRAMSKVTIPAGTSAMVPVIQKTLQGEPFTLVRDEEAPATCMRVENDTGLVLQQGLASFFMDGRFRGQTEIVRTEPAEVRLWCFGQDPDVRVSKRRKVQTEYDTLEWKKQELWAHLLKRTTETYTVENKAGQPRRIAIDVRHIPNGRVVSPQGLKSGERENHKLLLFEILARSKKVQKIIVEEGVMRKVPHTIETLGKLSRMNSLKPDQRAVLKKARSYLLTRIKLKEAIHSKEMAVIRRDRIIDRHRKTLGAVPQMQGHSKNVDDILGRILKLEAEVQALNGQIEAYNKTARRYEAATKRSLKTLSP